MRELVISGVGMTITKIRENLSIGILLVEQMVDRALGIADRAYVIERGAVTLSGVASDVAGSSEVRRSYLGDSSSNDATPPSGAT